MTRATAEASEQLGEGVEEAAVLRLRPVGDPNVARAPERGPGANDHPAPAESLDDLGLVAVAEIDPGEVGLRRRRPQAEVVQRVLDADPLRDRPLDPRDYIFPYTTLFRSDRKSVV